MPSSGGATMRCKHCRYRLENLPDNRCPECGEAFDPKERRKAARREVRRRDDLLGGVLFFAIYMAGAFGTCIGSTVVIDMMSGHGLILRSDTLTVAGAFALAAGALLAFMGGLAAAIRVADRALDKVAARIRDEESSSGHDRTSS